VPPDDSPSRNQASMNHGIVENEGRGVFVVIRPEAVFISRPHGGGLLPGSTPQ
jgi:hypothetical protein